MFLIECSADNSLLILEENYAICDVGTVKSGDIIKFVYNKKIYDGKILMHSDDKQKLKDEMKKVRASMNRKIPAKSSPNVVMNTSNRSRKNPRRDLPSNNLKNKKKAKIDPVKKKMVNPNTKFNKQYSSESDLSIVSEDEINFKDNRQEATLSSADNWSPTSLSNSPPKNLSNSSLKNVITTPSEQSENSIVDEMPKQKLPQERLPRQILEYHEELEDDEFDNLDDDEQLFGPNFDDSMVHLQNNIFCKRKVLRYALSSSSQATHIARKLLDGVFKKEALLKCTFTGQPGRAQIKCRQEVVEPMHQRAKNAIIQYSKKIAEKKHWTVNSTDNIKKSMTQKLVEIKLQERKNRA
ncbi:uncharacterized protein LOC105834482 isoform X2 [Monomorium pharaonis]|uniref:uncharacterized protein LOC105834482 isoform X2 n=1 Tax=Monomorium pharaonis TaxID=307658 RepID=UPI001746D683|nr:uncharacterized protein LOC105834482 isoform X2 [Monomorium pharaonis]